MRNMSRRIFKAKDANERRSLRKVFRVTEDESKQIKKAADDRQMDEGEFMRRAALGRRADVDHETEIVLALSEVTRAVRAIHADLIARGIAPPEEALLPLILDARAAMLRISK